MRKGICVLILALLPVLPVCGQQVPPVRNLDLNPFYGSILRHNPDISHLIRAHPGGFILGLNRKTFGAEPWEQRFGYPDQGISFI